MADELEEIKISEMTPATLPLSGTELIPGVQAGANINLTPNDILAIINSLAYSGLNTTDKHVITAINELLTAIGSKADILPTTGATSALRALFVARGATYHADTGLYSMHNGLVTNITEAQQLLIFLVTNNAINMGAPTGIMAFTNIRTHCEMTTDRGYFGITASNLFQQCPYLEAVVKNTGWGIYVTTLYNYFYNCGELHTINFLHIEGLTSAGQAANAFTNCYKLSTCNIKGTKISLSFGSCPLLTLESLQFLITYRQNGTTRITITVHPTVWSKLNDSVGYPTWNALLVDAVNNRYVDFASA